MDSLIESCPVQYPWLNLLLVLNMNLQNVDQHHFSLTSGQPHDRVASQRVSVHADTQAPQMQENVSSGFYWITFHNQAKVKA